MFLKSLVNTLYSGINLSHEVNMSSIYKQTFFPGTLDYLLHVSPVVYVCVYSGNLGKHNSIACFLCSMQIYVTFKLYKSQLLKGRIGLVSGIAVF